MKYAHRTFSDTNINAPESVLASCLTAPPISFLPTCRHSPRRCSRAAALAPTSASQRVHQGQQGRQPRSPRRRRPLASRRAQQQLTMMTCTAK